MRTLQIGMTTSAHHLSGTDRYYLSLLHALPPFGVSISGLVLGDPSSVGMPTDDVASFAPEHCSRWRRWSGLRKAVSQRIGDCDLVVSHAAPHAFPALDTMGRKPLIVHFHGPWALEGSAEGLRPAAVAIRRFQEQSVYGRGRRFIALSRSFAKILERSYHVDPAAIRIVPGGVDLTRFDALGTRREARAQLGWPLDRPILVTVRRLTATKGLEQLIDAVKIARDQVPDLFVAIVGTGPLASDLQRRVDERGLSKTIQFAGHVPDEALPLAYRAADVFIVPTMSLEGFGLVVVEALACRTPVLVTPVGGLPEVVADLEPGLILRGTSASDLADGIAGAFRGELPLPDEAACRAHAERFAWSTIAERVRDVYREVA